MVLIVLFGVLIARSVCHSITWLDAPLFADPRQAAELRCRYSRSSRDPPLHSVKWYRDSQEIFRYTPQELETRVFNNTGVSVTNSSCDHHSCTILVRPDRGYSKYTCEVSSERPRFAIDRRSINMTLAVLPEYDPLITGLPTLVYPDEEAVVNCTSDHSLPAADIDWFIDDEPQEDPLVSSGTYISRADGDGLAASWRALHIVPDDHATSRGYLSLRCRATVRTRPPHVRTMAVRLYVARRPHLSKFTANSSGCKKNKSTALLLVYFVKGDENTREKYQGQGSRVPCDINASKTALVNSPAKRDEYLQIPQMMKIYKGGPCPVIHVAASSCDDLRYHWTCVVWTFISILIIRTKCLAHLLD